MRIIIQRVSQASVTVHNNIVGTIQQGLLVFAGIVNEDNLEDIEWLSHKIVQLRIFNDAAGLMNLSVKEIDGDILLISQFTLHAATKKGNRPSFIKAAKPEIANPIFEQLILHLEQALGKKIEKGIFGADMKVALLNDGPVTIFIDSKNRE
ncbi:MAG: D-tyrosyl-tRNA(Tyr) deacylase [Sphingobacteriales bacterium]|uniref:D-aminoacyl-tRNA deacylase n=1 Tax=Hydrotalea flava TaxID=714549 RepID=UPI0008363CB7|nr:D-aminoacyl-tRNA deacylase [Hydrotalea flava]RTL47828.1 MAG: D-tyrosyl-tRNA(Tyr) deacylase [Sphingobacteriales bacterium]